MSKFRNIIWYALIWLIVLVGVFSFFINSTIVTCLSYITVAGLLVLILIGSSPLQKIFKRKNNKY